MSAHVFLAVLAVAGVSAPVAVAPPGPPPVASDHGPMPMPGTAEWGRDLLRHQGDPPARPGAWDGDPLMGNWRGGPPLAGFGLGWLWPRW